jgi:hypothetical protein
LLVSVIGLVELLRAAKEIQAQTLNSSALIAAALIYLTYIHRTPVEPQDGLASQRNRFLVRGTRTRNDSTGAHDRLSPPIPSRAPVHV